MSVVTARGAVAVEVQSWPVTARGPVNVAVKGPTITARGPVKVAVDRIAYTARGAVNVTVYGPPITARGPVAASVNPFAGTGVRRSRFRTPIPVRSKDPTIVPPPPPPPATVVRHLQHPFWTTPLAVDTPLASTSADYVSRLTYQAVNLVPAASPVAGFYGQPYNTATNSGSYAICLYVMPAGTPRVPVWAARVHPGYQAILDAGVPIPDPALTGGTVAPDGTDGPVLIIDAGTFQMWEMWRFHPTTPTDQTASPTNPAPTPDGYAWTCGQGGYMADYRTHPGWWAASAGYGGNLSGHVLGNNWGATASGGSHLGHLLTAEDYYGDTIHHPLLLALPLTFGGPIQSTAPGVPRQILPATRSDQKTFIPGGQDPASVDALRVIEGARFRLPPDVWTDTVIASYAASHGVAQAGVFGSTAPTLAKIMRQQRDYGSIIMDSAGVTSFVVEHPMTFGTPYNPYTAAQVPSWGNFGHQLPWSSYVQVAASATDISVPGGG